MPKVTKYHNKTNAQLAVEIKAGREDIRKCDSAISVIKAKRNDAKQHVDTLVSHLADRLDPRYRKAKEDLAKKTKAPAARHDSRRAA